VHIYAANVATFTSLHKLSEYILKYVTRVIIKTSSSILKNLKCHVKLHSRGTESICDDQLGECFFFHFAGQIN